MIAGNGEVAGHADLLAAGDPTAIHPTDSRLLAVQDGVHHGDEQVDVGTVLLGTPTVILGVLLGVAAGAEETVAHSRKHDCYHGTIHGSGLESGDNALHHLGGVGVTLLRVVQGDPGGVQSCD